MEWVEEHKELNVDPQTKFVLQNYFDYDTKQFEQILQSGKMMLNDVRVATDVEKKIADIVKIGKEFVDRVVYIKLTPKEKKYVVDLLNVFRKLKQVEDITHDLYDKMYDLNYQIGTLYNMLPDTLDEFNDQHIEDVERDFIIYREINGLTFNQVDTFLKKFVPLLNDTPFTNEKFQSTMKDIVKLLDKIKPYPASFISKEFTNSLGAKWVHVLQTLRNSGVSALKDEFDVYAIYATWRHLTKIKQDEILDKISDGVDYIVNSATQLDKHLRNNVNPEATFGDPEATFDDPFEEFAFADERYGQVPSEPDNKLERKLYRALIKHFVNNVPLSPENAKQFQDVLKSGKYFSVIHGPTQDFVYRGMTVPAKWIRAALKLNKDDKLPDVGHKEASFTFKPRQKVGATSWTTQQETAIDFADDSFAEDYQIVMVAEVANNKDKFIMCDDGLYKIDGLNLHEDEDEVIALNNINVSMIAWKKALSEEDFPML
jgi:hypothetical protein